MKVIQQPKMPEPITISCFKCNAKLEVELVDAKYVPPSNEVINPIWDHQPASVEFTCPCCDGVIKRNIDQLPDAWKWKVEKK